MFMALVKWGVGTIGRPIVTHWLKKPRETRFLGLPIRVMPGVFHPGLYFSSGFLAEYLGTLELNGKRVLESGCGTGAISIWCASRGARITATDISPTAVDNARFNALQNLPVCHFPPVFLLSDVLSAVPVEPFDLLVANPPYFFGSPVSEASQAWYCGPEGEYFHAFFKDLGKYLHPETQVFMVLADNCDIPRISAIAMSYGFILEKKHTKKIWWEENYIFIIRKESATC